MAGALMRVGSDRFRLAQNSDINVTPFVDVMLVLLIIFMVAIPVATVSLKVDLPQASGDGPPARPTYVSLQRDGRLFIGDKATTLASLPTDLAASVGGPHPQAQRIYVRADKGVRYGDFVRVVSQLRQSGFHAVGLVAEDS